MAKQPQNQDDIRDLPWPYAGLSLTQPAHLKGNPGTCEVAENVVYFDQGTGRARGASRSGLTRWLPDQVSGDHEIQHIGAIVTIHGEMIDWSEGGPEQRFPGIYAGIGFIDFDFIPLDFPSFLTERPDGVVGSETFSSASGYPPKKPKNERIVATLVSEHYESDTNVNIQLTATIRDRNGGFLSAETLDGLNFLLHTDPPGKIGDGDFGSAGGSQLTPLVQDSVDGTVYYWVTLVSVLGNVVAKSNTIHIKYNKVQNFAFVQSNRSHDTVTSGAQRSLTFTSQVQQNSLLLLVEWTPGGIGTVTDTQSNTWTPFTPGLAGSPSTVYYAFASASAACTVKFTPNASSLSTWAILEYTCPPTAAPFNATNDSDSTLTPNTFTAVQASPAGNNLFLGILHYTGTEVNTGFTQQTGYNLRINDPLQTVGVGDHALFVWDKLSVSSNTILSGTLTDSVGSWVCEGCSFTPS